MEFQISRDKILSKGRPRSHQSFFLNQLINFKILPLPKLSCQNYFAKIILPKLFCQNYFAKIILPKLYCQNYFAKIIIISVLISIGDLYFMHWFSYLQTFCSVTNHALVALDTYHIVFNNDTISMIWSKNEWTK